ncbi:MAG TPA: orotate phosphoribosyltransferase [Geobacterales bacterium]|nr:orotate phosphoribosyltransferase [Geobacterales bacterium]
MVDIAKLILDYGAVKFGDFTLSSSKKSNVYVDMRSLISIPHAYKEIIKEAINVLQGLKFDAIGGIPTGGLIWASFIAYELNYPLCYVRKEEKGHGTSKLIEGSLPKASTIILVDDVATTGSSLSYAAEKLREHGYVVNDALVLVDREEGAKDMLFAKGIKLHSLVKLKDLLV